MSKEEFINFNRERSKYLDLILDSERLRGLDNRERRCFLYRKLDEWRDVSASLYKTEKKEEN